LLGSASTRSGFTGLFLTYPASALSPRLTCLADPVADPEKNLGGAEKHATTTCSSLRHPTKEKYNSLK